MFAEGFDPPKGEERIIDTIIILQYSAERKVFLTVVTCLCSFFHKKNTGASIETPVFHNNIFLPVTCRKMLRTAAMCRA